MKIYHINFSNIEKKHQNFNQVYITSLKGFRIFSNLFDSQPIRTPIINVNWCSCAIAAMEKRSSYIPTSKVIRSCSYKQISLKSSNAFQSSISNEMLIF